MKKSYLSLFKSYRIESGLIFCLGCCFIIPVFRSLSYLYSSFVDDFFYYLKIADNFINGYGSSFVKGIETNGYHPFYQFFICCIAYISKTFGCNVLVLSRVCFSLIFIISSCILLKLIQPKTLLSRILFTINIFGYFFFGFGGMETIFLIPCLSVFLIRLHTNSLNSYSAAAFGAFIFFLRIDSIILFIPPLIYFFIKNNAFVKKNYSRFFLSFLIFTIPLTIYLFLNYLCFGVLFPISGISKTVSEFDGLHAATFKYFISWHMPFNLIVIVSLVLTINYLLTPWQKTNWFVLVYLAAIILMFVQISLRSDWGLFSWYLYPFPVLMLLINAEANVNVQINAEYFRYSFWLLIVSIPISVLFAYRFTFPHQPEIMDLAGLKIRNFEKEHKGVYAMGDRAGIVGYLLESPLIQLEGLVMDKTYYERLKTSKNLKDLLAPYNTEYYICSYPKKLNDSTYIVSEPNQSLGYSPKIVDTISWPIAFEFELLTKHSFRKDLIISTIIFKVPR